jgi:hypothetical protein
MLELIKRTKALEHTSNAFWFFATISKFLLKHFYSSEKNDSFHLLQLNFFTFLTRMWIKRLRRNQHSICRFQQPPELRVLVHFKLRRKLLNIIKNLLCHEKMKQILMVMLTYGRDKIEVSLQFLTFQIAKQKVSVSKKT